MKMSKEDLNQDKINEPINEADEQSGENDIGGPLDQDEIDALLAGADDISENSAIKFPPLDDGLGDGFISSLELPKIFFPLTLKFKDTIMKAGDFNNSEVRPTNLKKFKGERGSILLGEKEIASAKLLVNRKGKMSVKIDKCSFSDDENLLQQELFDCKFNFSVELGRMTAPASTVENIKGGSIIEFDRLAGAPLRIIIDEYESVIAYGEVVVINESFGVRIVDMADASIGEISTLKYKIKDNSIQETPSISIRSLLGKIELSLTEFLGMGEGSIFELDRLAGAPADILIGDTLRLAGDIIVLDENFAVRVIKDDYDSSQNLNASVPSEETEDNNDTVSPDKVSSAIREFISNNNHQHIANYLSGEHPQAAAMFLSQIDLKDSSSILSCFPDKFQADIVERVAAMKYVSPEVVNDVITILQRKFENVVKEEEPAKGGVVYASALMKKSQIINFNDLSIQNDKIIQTDGEEYDDLDFVEDTPGLEITDSEEKDYMSLAPDIVKEGEVIAVPAEKGPGYIFTADVSFVLADKNNSLFTPGEGIEIDELGQMVSTCHGNMIMKDNVINVLSCYLIKENISLSTGNVTYNGTVIIAGNVNEGFSVNAGGNIILFDSISDFKLLKAGGRILKIDDGELSICT
jgi:flagellar motor switch/type III secretory pathway protein FliN